VEALEVQYDILCEGSGALELADAVASAWDWCLADRAAEDPARPPHPMTVVLEERAEDLEHSAGQSSLFGLDLATVMDRLSPMLTGLALTARRGELTMFHACAVADPDTGDAVVLYGPSGTGKTTLARTLCTDLVYLSDETAAVTPDLRLLPYPKPLSVIAGSGPGLKDQLSPRQLRLVRPDDRDYRLRGLVQLCREPVHDGEATLEPLATVDALPELVAQTSFTRDLDRPLHQLADLVRQTGGVRRATYAEAEQLRPLVRAMLDGDA
jgi:hypothetical protein